MKSNVPSPKDDNADLPRISAQSPFRAIRQKLFTEGKLVRYLGYAVGEIALIIVGIFFALQLNNWNEDRKAQAEFELYVIQLREDVKTAIGNVKFSKSMTETFSLGVEYIPVFLELSNYEPGELEKFELGLNYLPLVNTPQVKVGLLGQIIDGDLDIISRDPGLSKRALEMESFQERILDNIQRNSNQMELAAANRLSHFLGLGDMKSSDSYYTAPPKYNLERLKANEDFLYVIHYVQSLRGRITDFDDLIVKNLESFLTILEEYDKR